MQRYSLTLCAVIALVLSAACSSGSTPPPPAQTAPAGKPVDAATAATIDGRVVFEGVPPPADTLKMGIDAACVKVAGTDAKSDAVLVGDGGALQNVFVYVKSGLDAGYSFPTPTQAVVLDQHGCRYAPRIVGIQVGQPIEIVNSDETLHNVHTLPMSNKEYNKSQNRVGQRDTITFTVPEVMVRFKCDAHSWMTAYVGVLTHPYYSVTDALGRFSLKGLPPGTYTIEAWHERFGHSETSVTVGANETQTIGFTFSEGK